MKPGGFSKLFAKAGTAFLVLAAIAAALCIAAGQTNTAQPAPPAHRYLLVVDVSKSVEDRADGTTQAVQDLIASSLGGHARDGDTLGVWTFDEEIHVGQFPLQHWSAGARDTIAANVVRFLVLQKYAGKSNLKNALGAADRLIQDSRLITVILVSDGSQKIEGTPFDERINGAYQVWRKKQEKVRMPLVTALRAENGQMTGFSVTQSPQQVQLPLSDSESSISDSPRPYVIEPAHEIASSTNGSTNNIEREIQQVPIAVRTNGIVRAPVKAIEPLIFRGTQSTETRPADTHTAVEPLIFRGTQSVPDQVAAPSSAPASKVAVPLAAGVNDKPIASYTPPVPTTAIVVTGAPATVERMNATVSEVAALPPSTVRVENATAIATPSRFFNRRAFWGAALMAIGVALTFCWVKMRRSRAPDHPSLITRSLEREQDRRGN